MGALPNEYLRIEMASPGACCECGVHFMVPAYLLQRFKETGAWFFCPNGHRQHYTKTTVQRLEEQLEREREATSAQARRAEMAERRANMEQRSARAYKGRVTRIKNRIKNGVCPCCNRSFENLARHMATKHPGFDPDNASRD